MKRIFFFLSAMMLLAGCNGAIRADIELIQKDSYDLSAQNQALEESIKSLEAADKEVKDAIAELSQEGETHKGEISELKEYDKSLQKAIDDLKAQMQEKVMDAQKWITETTATLESYNTLLNEINNRLDELLRVFKISFDDSEIGIFQGGSAVVHYTIEGATPETKVSAFGQNGFSAKVRTISHDKGEIIVTANGSSLDEVITVVVYDGAYRTIMSTIDFAEGVSTPSVSVLYLPGEAGVKEFTLTTNCYYEISIPEADRAWLSVVQTKSMRTDKIAVSYAANEKYLRKTEISVLDRDMNVIQTIPVVQEVRAMNNKIFYTAASQITFDDSALSSPMVSHEFSGNHGVITCQEDLTMLNESVFAYSELTSITVPSTVKTIGAKAFSYCESLSEVNLLEGLTTIEEAAFQGCSSLVNIIIPSTVTKFGTELFTSGAGLKNLILSEGISKIDDMAFIAARNIENLVIPESVKSIGDGAFQGCEGIKSVTFPEGLTKIGSLAFHMCNNLVSVSIPGTITKIELMSFSDCPNLKKIELHEGLKHIGPAFANCTSLEELTIPESVEVIDGTTFECCTSLRKVTIKAPLTLIDAHIFSECHQLSSIEFPETLESIGFACFYNCYELKSIVLPAKLKTIENSAFEYAGLTTIVSENTTPPAVYSGIFTKTPSLRIYVPEESVEKYKAAQYWSDYADYIEGVDLTSRK